MWYELHMELLSSIGVLLSVGPISHNSLQLNKINIKNEIN